MNKSEKANIFKTFVFITILGVSTGLIFLYLSNKKVEFDSKESEASEDTTEASSNIEYFGYYFTTKPNLDLQASSHTNLTFIDPSQIQGQNRKTIFNLAKTAVWTRNAEGKRVLNSDWKNKWIKAWDKVSEHHDKIAFVYLIDEPGLNLEEYNEFIALSNHVSTFLKNNNPDVKTMTTYSASFTLRIGNDPSLLPESLYLAGFDEYHCFGKNECFGNTAYKDKFDILADLQESRENKAFVVFNGFVFSNDPEYIPTEIEQKRLIRLNDKILNVCLSRKEVCVGGIAFLYESQIETFSGKELIGVDAMPLVKDQFVDIGNRILSGRFNYESKFLGNNIAAGKNVLTSNTHNSTENFNITDGKTNTAWNAGDHPPQWIEIDLGKEYVINGLKLHIAQNPEGETRHDIYTGDSNKNYSHVESYNSVTKTGDTILHFFLEPREKVQWIKVNTTLSPSWVAWEEIEVFSTECTPDCTGKECGDDGCEGSCGTCSDNMICSSNKCVTECTPDCTGKECGDDGCEGSCGTCSADKICISNKCTDGESVNVDLDGNGKVDGKDYGIILSDWADYYDNNKLNNRSDLNGNGKIDGPDYTLFLQGWSDYFKI